MLHLAYTLLSVFLWIVAAALVIIYFTLEIKLVVREKRGLMLPSDVSARRADLHRGSHDHILDRTRIDAGLGNGRLDGVTSQCLRLSVVERASMSFADGRACSG